MMYITGRKSHAEVNDDEISLADPEATLHEAHP